jgi:hypothetical protein
MLAFVFFRAHHAGYSLAVLPVCVLPLFHLVIRLILYASKGVFFGYRAPVVTAFVNVIGLAVSCAAIVLIGQRIEPKRNRSLYLVVMLVYSVLLAWAYIFNALGPLLG